MAIQSGLFRSDGGDRRYKAEFFASYFASFVGNGVFPQPSTGLQVVVNSNLSIDVRAGKGWINGYYLVNDSNYTLQHDIADSNLNRIDRVVMGLNLLTREIGIYIKKGLSSTIAEAPNLQRDNDIYELALADVYIAAGTVSIQQSNITDTRFNTSLCGIVASTIQQIDTTNLFAQYQDAFQRFFDGLIVILDGDVATNLAAEIVRLENDLRLHEADYVKHPGFGITTNNGNNYSVQLDPAPTQYVDGFGLAVIINQSSIDAPTFINVNGLGNVPILNGSLENARELRANAVYAMRYYNGNFILQGEGGGVLSGITAGDIIVFSDRRTLNLPYNFSAVKALRVNSSGTVRVSFDIRAFYSNPITGQIHVNGNPVGTLRTNSTNIFVTYTEDITVNKNDIISVYGFDSTGAGFMGTLSLSLTNSVYGEVTL